MPKIKTTTPPITGTISTDLQGPDGVSGAKKVAVSTVDGIDAKTVKGIKSAATVAATTLPTIPETFPIDALSKIDGKGVSGTTFMLDAGSLRGLKLQIRRVKDGEQPGFELVFQLTEDKVAGLLERMKEKKATTSATTFRAVSLDDDGVARYTSATATISGSGSHSPPDLDTNSAAWALVHEDAKGGRLEVAHDKAALALRGMVRVHLRGDDKKCTEQLQGLVAGLGLQHLFAPPTQKSKQIHALMRVLWQVDHAAAKSITSEGLDKVKVEDLEAALASAGYDAARIAKLRYEEVFPGHFTVVDPTQAEDMAKAGARYLYSTVTDPEHVLSILQNGQKSSVQRYKDGLIINGMSTNADFVTGGGCGVFTRLVTQNAIYDEKSWAGRTYKLVQNYSQLARTDWYGWDGDFYGRRWQLDTQTNFGTSLVNKITENGGYKDYNELIFTAGNRPENIDRVVATNDNDRQKLVKLLNERGYVPHNGLSVEEFVVCSPKFMVFGPSPYAKIDDLAAFAGEALELAKKGNLGQLQWLLYEGPGGPARAELEQKILLDGPPKARDLLLKTAARTGRFELTGAALEPLLATLSAGSDEQKAVFARLPKEAAEALFRSGSETAYQALLAQKPAPGNGYYAPYGISDDNFVRLYAELAKAQPAGKPRSPAFQLALDVRAEQLLASGHAGFKAFLEKTPLITPSDPKAWAAEKIASVKASGAGKAELAMYLAQLKDPAALGALQLQLLAADAPATLELLQTSLKTSEQSIAVSGEALHQALVALPTESATRKQLLAAPTPLLKTAHPGLLAMALEANQGGYYKDFGIGGDQWAKILEAQLAVTGGAVTETVRKTAELGSSRLSQSAGFKELIGKLGALYDAPADPAAFATTALAELAAPGGGAIKLGWMVHGPQAETLREPALLALLRSTSYEAQTTLNQLRGNPPSFPASDDQLRALVAKLAAPEDQQAVARLASAAGKSLLLAADGPTLEVLEKQLSANGSSISQFGLHGESVTALLKELGGKKGDAALVRSFVLRMGAAELLKGADASFLAYLGAEKLGYAALGKDAAWAAQVVHEAVSGQSYYWNSSYYASYPDYMKMPEGAKFLLGVGAKYDEALLGEIEQKLKGWGWQQGSFDQFMKLCDDMPEAWKAKLVAAYKGS